MTAACFFIYDFSFPFFSLIFKIKRERRVCNMNWYFIAFEVFGFIFTLFGIYHFFIVFKNRNYDRYSRAIMIMILGIVTMFFPIVFKVIFKL